MIWQILQNCHLIHAHLVSGWRRGEEQICFKTSFASLTNKSIWGAFSLEYHPVESGYLLWGDCCYGPFLCRKIILRYLYRWYERSWQGSVHFFPFLKNFCPSFLLTFCNGFLQLLSFPEIPISPSEGVMKMLSSSAMASCLGFFLAAMTLYGSLMTISLEVSNPKEEPEETLSCKGSVDVANSQSSSPPSSFPESPSGGNPSRFPSKAEEPWR